jgi:hypothetical protein
MEDGNANVTETEKGGKSYLIHGRWETKRLPETEKMKGKRLPETRKVGEKEVS